MTKELEWENVSTFNWKELHNRQVTVIVVEDSGMQSVCLYDAESEEIFVVSVKKLEDGK